MRKEVGEGKRGSDPPDISSIVRTGVGGGEKKKEYAKSKDFSPFLKGKEKKAFRPWESCAPGGSLERRTTGGGGGGRRKREGGGDHRPRPWQVPFSKLRGRKKEGEK